MQIKPSFYFLVVLLRNVTGKYGMLYSSEIKTYFCLSGWRWYICKKLFSKLLDKSRSNYEFPAFDNEYMEFHSEILSFSLRC